MSLNIQFVTMAAMIGSGFYIGMAADTFYRFHRRKKRNKLTVYVYEILFWILQSLIIFYILFLINQGEIRFYIWIAILCGFAGYQALFKSLYLTILEQCIMFAARLVHVCRRLVELLIIAPVQWMVKLLIYILSLIWGILFWLLSMLWKIIQYPVMKVGKLILAIVPKNVKKCLVQKGKKYSKIKGIINQWWKKLMRNRR